MDLNEHQRPFFMPGNYFLAWQKLLSFRVLQTFLPITGIDKELGVGSARSLSLTSKKFHEHAQTFKFGPCRGAVLLYFSGVN